MSTESLKLGQNSDPSTWMSLCWRIRSHDSQSDLVSRAWWRVMVVLLWPKKPELWERYAEGFPSVTSGRCSRALSCQSDPGWLICSGKPCECQRKHQACSRFTLDLVQFWKAKAFLLLELIFLPSLGASDPPLVTRDKAFGVQGCWLNECMVSSLLLFVVHQYTWQNLLIRTLEIQLYPSSI